MTTCPMFKSGYGTREELAAAFAALPEATNTITETVELPTGEKIQREVPFGKLAEGAFEFWSLRCLPETPANFTSGSITISDDRPIIHETSVLESSTTASSELKNPVDDTCKVSN